MANEKSFPKWKRLFALLKIDNRKEEIGFGWNCVFNSEICRFKADSPGGKFERLTENPILEFEDTNKHMEDPFLWYDESRKKFCMLAKDDSKNGDCGITGEWSAGFYAAIIPLIKAKNIAINDLYGLVYPVKEEVIRDDDLIHLNDNGINLCADQVVASIKKLL
ncbi:MAG: hypothetical protein SOT09_06715 [Candidatus Borkfalkiaceae bacterium]|nr:hypothetical protein [Christensenellaceae bacterium]